MEEIKAKRTGSFPFFPHHTPSPKILPPLASQSGALCISDIIYLANEKSNELDPGEWVRFASGRGYGGLEDDHADAAVTPILRLLFASCTCSLASSSCRCCCPVVAVAAVVVVVFIVALDFQEPASPSFALFPGSCLCWTPFFFTFLGRNKCNY